MSSATTVPVLDVVELPVFGTHRRVRMDRADAEQFGRLRRRLQRRRGGQGSITAHHGGKWVQLKRLILGLASRAPGVCVFPINGDQFDLCRHNLKTGSHRASCLNRNLRNRANKSSQYFGVSRSGNRWKATICIDRRTLHLGTFDTEKVAAIARDTAARAAGLPEDCMNFPPPSVLDHFEREDGNDVL